MGAALLSGTVLRHLGLCRHPQLREEPRLMSRSPLPGHRDQQLLTGGMHVVAPGAGIRRCAGRLPVKGADNGSLRRDVQTQERAAVAPRRGRLAARAGSDDEDGRVGGDDVAESLTIRDLAQCLIAIQHSVRSRYSTVLDRYGARSIRCSIDAQSGPTAYPPGGGGCEYGSGGGQAAGGGGYG